MISRIFIFMIFCSTFGTASAASVQYIPDVMPDDDTIIVSAPEMASLHPAPESDPLISINAGLDMNLSAALNFSDPALRPTPITVPLLTEYSLDNLEVKLRVLNVRF